MLSTLPNFLFDILRNSLIAIGLPLTLGLLSGSATKGTVRGIRCQSLLFPPGRLPRPTFSIIGVTLYIEMGYASYLAASHCESAVLTWLGLPYRETISTGLEWYYVQLALNLLWGPIFFGAASHSIALAVAVALTGSAWYMIRLFHGTTEGATTPSLILYCTWLGFMIYTNGAIVRLNRGRNLPKGD